MSNAKGWTEIFEGGSPEAERNIFLALAEDMLRIQEANRQKSGASAPGRTLHAKLVAGFTHATLKIDRTLPDDFAVSWCQNVSGAVAPFFGEVNPYASSCARPAIRPKRLPQYTALSSAHRPYFWSDTVKPVCT